jgi:hypothetical protein
VPLDVADDAAKIGLELAQAPVGAFELMGMGVTLVRDQCQLAANVWPAPGLQVDSSSVKNSKAIEWAG